MYVEGEKVRRISKTQGNVRWTKCVCLLSLWVVSVVGVALCWYGIMRYDSTLAALLLLLVVPAVIPPLFAFFSLGAFPLPYSALGTLKRSPLPLDQQPLVTLRSSWIKTPHFVLTCPGVTWMIFPGGLGISMELIGKVYIPRESIVSIHFNWQRNCVITHTCEEFRTPVLGPGKLANIIRDSWNWGGKG